MNIYVAASASRHLRAAEIARQLQTIGISIVSRWHEQTGAETPGYENPALTPEMLAEKAQGDLNDVRRADGIVMITGDTETRGGRHSELGMAIMRGLRIWLLGPREQVFHYLQRIIVCETEDELLRAVRAALNGA